MLELRKYQQDAIDAVFSYIEEGRGKAPLVVLPTGAGKSLFCAEFCKRVVQQWPEQRIAVCTHSKELIGQNYLEMVSQWPEAPAGIYSAGHKRRDKNKNILFCGIQSVYKNIHDVQYLHVLFIDEAQLLPFKGQGMYRTFIEKMMRINPNLIVIGMTATPYRLQGGWLHRGEGALFDGIAYEAKILDLVDEGYLCRLVSKNMNTKLDVSGVSKSGGEFVNSQLQKAVDLPEITKAAVSELVSYGHDRNCWLVFGSGIDHCEHIAEEIRSYGITAECVFGNTPSGERDRIFKGHRSGSIKCMVNRFVGCIGYNNPMIDLIDDMAPTGSAALHVQKLGRGTRNHRSKTNCLVLDHAQNISRHGPIDKVNPQQPKAKSADQETEAPVKSCPECATFFPISFPECPECGFQFPPPKPKIEQTASDLAPMSSADPDWIKIDSVHYMEHYKAGKPVSLKVQYQAGLKIYPKWVLLEHWGSARRNAENWWIRNAKTPPPSNVTEALQRKEELMIPQEIAIVKSGKHWDVIDAR